MKTLDFARKHLFESLGIIDVEWERSSQGFDAGYGEMWLKHGNITIKWKHHHKLEPIVQSLSVK